MMGPAGGLRGPYGLRGLRGHDSLVIIESLFCGVRELASALDLASAEGRSAHPGVRTGAILDGSGSDPGSGWHALLSEAPSLPSCTYWCWTRQESAVLLSILTPKNAFTAYRTIEQGIMILFHAC